MLQIGGEDGGGERGLNGIEVRNAFLWAAGVDLREGQSQETVVVGVRDELGAGAGGSLDRLGDGSNAAYNNGVAVDNTLGARAILVLDLPFLARLLLSRAGIVDGVSLGLPRCLESREHPP